MSFSVTATPNNTFDTTVLKVYVITRGTTGGTAIASGAFGTPSYTLNPSGNGSLVVSALFNVGATAVTPAANNATDDSGTTNHGSTWWDGHYTGAVTSGSPVALGGTDDNNWNAWAAYEALSSGSVAIDASTPVAAKGVSTGATTSAFTPPAGALLVALPLANGSGTQTFVITDTSGLGLVWTQQASYVPPFGNVGSAAVFTVVVPGGSQFAAAASLSGSGAMSAQGAKQASGTASLSGAGAMTAASGVIVPGTVSLTGTGVLSGTPGILSQHSATVSGTGTLSASSASVRRAVASLTGAGAITAHGEGGNVVPASASFSAAAVLTCSPLFVRIIMATDTLFPANQLGTYGASGAETTVTVPGVTDGIYT